MPQANANGVSICYELRGPADGPPVLLIMGFNMTLVAWPEGLLAALEKAGLRLILMDNRDAGLSQRMTDSGDTSALHLSMKRLLGQPRRPPYTLTDMAGDCAALLSVLNVEKAHVIGISMGGMIAQCLAISHPDRVRSLALLMTHGGSLRHAMPSPGLLPLVLQGPGDDPESMTRYAIRFWQQISGPGYPSDPDQVLDSMRRALERSPTPNGRKRQMAAIAASADRTRQLRQLRLPVVVIHGDSDPLVPVSGGRELARVIPNARFHLIPGLGHTLPDPLHQFLATAIVDNMGRGDEP